MVPFFVHFFNGNGRKIAHYIFVLSDRVRKWDRKYGKYGIRKNTYLSVYERVMVHFWCRFLGIEKAYKVGNQSLIDFRLRSEGDSNTILQYFYSICKCFLCKIIRIYNEKWDRLYTFYLPNLLISSY